MITKGLLEETIRRVIREFKLAKRIPDPAADELTAALQAQVDNLFDEDSMFSYKQVEDSVSYVEDLRKEAQVESAEGFLREVMAWQQTHSS